MCLFYVFDIVILLPQMTFSAFPPSFCYILQASVTRPPLIAAQCLGDRLPSLSKERESPTRLDLLGRLLYYGQEVSCYMYVT